MSIHKRNNSLHNFGVSCLAMLAVIFTSIETKAEHTTENPQAEAFIAGELLPLRAIDSGVLPNSIQMQESEVITLPVSQIRKLVDKSLNSSAVTYERSSTQLSTLSIVDSASPDSEITADIQSLANSLSRDPLKIYAYFTNNFTYEPYYFGSVKGSQETFYQKAGNDFDIASAFIATLRASGYQARYVRGKIRIPHAQGAKWIGTAEATTAANILSTAGYQTALYNDVQGNLHLLETLHVWVEFYDPSLSAWIALAPAFKEHTLPQGRNLSEEAGNDPYNLLQTITAAGMLSDTNGIMQPDLNIIDNFIEENESNITNHIGGSPQTTLGDIVKPRKVINKTISALPTSLPFNIQGSVTRHDEPTDAHRQHIQVALPGFSKKLSLPSVLSKRLTVDYIPATAAESTKISNYGGILNTPYQAVTLKPQLRVDGQVVATGNAVSIGSYQTMTVSFFKGSSGNGNVKHNVTAGGIYAIALDSQKVSEVKFNRSLSKLNTLKNTYSNDPLNEAFAGEMLHTLGMSYYRQLDNVIDNVSATGGSILFHQVSEALISIDLTARRNANGQYIMSVGSRGIDAPRNIYSIFSANNEPNFNRAGTMLSVGYAASALEHAVFEKSLGWPSVSTMSILRFAANHEIPIYRINNANLNTVLPQLDINANYKNSITSAVNSGRIVIVPQTLVNISGWNGIGYIVLDPNTGAAGFMINGGHAGGKSNFQPMDLLATHIAFVSDVIDIHAAYTQGVLWGEFNPNVYNTRFTDYAGATGAFVSDFFLVGDIRNIGITTWNLAFDNGGYSDVAIAAIGLIPMYDLVKGGYRIGSGFLTNQNLSAIEATYRSVSNNSTTLVANLSKNADIISATTRKLNGQFDAAITTASRNGMEFTNVMVKDGDAYARSLGINPVNMTPSTKALLGEKMSIDYATKTQGLSCFFCTGNPSANGLDAIFRDSNGSFIINETKFISGANNTGLGSLSGTGKDKQLTLEYLFGTTPGVLGGALARTSGLTDAQKQQVFQAYHNKKISTQLTVIKDRHSGSGITQALTKDEFLGNGGGSKIGTIIIIELPLRRN